MNWYDIVPSWVFGEENKDKAPDMQPIGYTGDGGDGVIQPRKPVEMVQSKQGPVMLHEGEGKMQNPDGSVSVVPQSQLQSIEAATGMKGMADGGTYDPADQLQPIGAEKPKTDYFDQGMKAIADTVMGNSAASKTMENSAIQGFSGAGLAKQGAAKQSGAQAGYDIQAQAGVAQRAARDLEGERSNMMNAIVQNKQQAATTAQGQLASYGMANKQQTQTETAYQDNKKQGDWDRMLLYYDPSTPEGLSQLQSAYAQMFGGKAPDFNVLKEQRDYARTKQQQDVSSGEKTLTAQDLQNISTQFGIDQNKASSVISAINQGATKDYLAQAFGVNLTDQQYSSMKQQYSEQRAQAAKQLTAQDLQNASTQLGINVNKIQAIVDAINSGSTKDLVAQSLGVNLTDQQYNSLKQQYSEQRAQASNQLTAQQLQNISSQLGINTATSQALVDAINSGATKDYLAQRFGINLSEQQYNSLKQQYSEERKQASQILTAAELQNVSTQLGINVATSQAVVDAINSGATKDYIAQRFGVNLSNQQFASMQEQYGQKIQVGNLSISSQQIQNAASQLGIDTQKMQNVVTAINSGATKSYVENYLGVPLTDAEYKGLKEQYVQKIQIGNLSITSQDLANTASKLGIDTARSQAAIEAINQGASRDYLQQNFGVFLSNQEFYAMQKKYAQSLTAGELELEGVRQQLGDQKFSSMVSRVTAGASVDRINNEFGVQLSKAEYNNMYEATETYFKKQGLSMEQASLYGYKDEKGNHVQGALEIAQGQLGLQGKTIELQEKELFGYTRADGTKVSGKYDLLSEENKRAADAMYGYDVQDGSGRIIGRVAGSLELANIASDLQKQEIDLESAQIKGYLDPKTGNYIKGSVALNAEKAGAEINSLYGYYYDPATGEVITDSAEIARRGDDLEKVDGSLSLAQKQFGLTEKSFELQRMELFGGYDDDDNFVKGKMQLLSAEDQRAAHQIYGYDEDLGGGETYHHPGTMELAKAELAIRSRGLTLDEAKIYGYTKPDGTKVVGELEIESKKLSLLESEYEKQQGSTAGTALASHFNLMSNTSGYNYESDPQAKKMLQDYWKATTGSNAPYDKEWADRQFQASTVSDIDSVVNEMKQSDWYEAMSDEEKIKMDDTVRYAAMLSVTGGVSPEYGDDGEIVALKDTDGDTIWQIKPKKTNISNATSGALSNVSTSGRSAGDVFVSNDSKYKVNDDGETVTQLDYSQWEKGFDKIKDDPRFNSLSSKGTITPEKWKIADVNTIDEYIKYMDQVKKGDINAYIRENKDVVVNGQVVSNRTVINDEVTGNPKYYVGGANSPYLVDVRTGRDVKDQAIYDKYLKGADKEDSPLYDLYRNHKLVAPSSGGTASSPQYEAPVQTWSDSSDNYYSGDDDYSSGNNGISV